MATSNLFIPKHQLKLYELKSIQQATDVASFKSALDFCCRWLQGEKSFTFHTSGSTGKPKEVQIAREKMELSAKNTLDFLQPESGGTALLCMDARMIGGAMLLVRAIAAGMDLLLVPPSKNPLQFVDRPIDFTSMVPLQWKTTLELSSEKVEEVLHEKSILLLGGGALDAHLAYLTSQLHLRAFATFGMTETVSHVAIRHLSSQPEETYFEGLGDVAFSISSNKTLQIKGSITDQQWLVTNDIVEIISPRKFKWLGRADFVINTGGIKVHPEAVESDLVPVLAGLGCQMPFFVGGLKDATYGEAVTLFLESENKTLETTLLPLIKEQFGTNTSRSFPKRILCIQNFIYTPSGKIDRLATLQLFNQSN